MNLYVLGAVRTRTPAWEVGLLWCGVIWGVAYRAASGRMLMSFRCCRASWKDCQLWYCSAVSYSTVSPVYIHTVIVIDSSSEATLISNSLAVGIVTHLLTLVSFQSWFSLLFGTQNYILKTVSTFLYNTSNITPHSLIVWSSDEKKKVSGFGTTWGWVNYLRIFVFGWTIPWSMAST